MSEDEWRDFEREVLDEVSPDGLEGFLVGSPYAGVTLDEEGKLKFIEIQQMGLSPGPLLKLFGVGGRAVSAGTRADARARADPAATQARLIARGVLPRTGPLRRPPVAACERRYRRQRARRARPRHRRLRHDHARDAADRHPRRRRRPRSPATAVARRVTPRAT